MADQTAAGNLVTRSPLVSYAASSRSVFSGTADRPSIAARSSVLTLGAGCDVRAPVAPRQTLQLEPDPQLAGVQVDEWLAESERFTLA